MALLRLLVFCALSLMNSELALIAHSAVITSGKTTSQPSVWYPLENFNVTLEDANAANVFEGSGSQLKFSDVSKIFASSKPANSHRVVAVINETPNDHTHRSQTQTEDLASNPLLRVKLLKGSVRDEIEQLFSGPQLIVRRSVNVSSDAAENVSGIVSNATSIGNDTLGDAAHSQDLQRDAQAHAGCAVAYFASVEGNCALALEYRGSPPAWFMEKIMPDDLTAVGDELLRSFGEDQACGCPAPDLSSTCPDALHAALAIVTTACATAANGGGAA